MITNEQLGGRIAAMVTAGINGDKTLFRTARSLVVSGMVQLDLPGADNVLLLEPSDPVFSGDHPETVAPLVNQMIFEEDFNLC